MKKQLLSLFALMLIASISFANMTNNPVNISFVQLGELAKIKLLNKKTGTYELTLTNIHPYVTYFSDRPNRIVGQYSNTAYLNHWNEGKDSFKQDAPNAVLNAEVVSKDKNQYINLIVDLSNPKFNSRKNSFSYDVHLLEQTSVPITQIQLNHAVLFIDQACFTC